MTRMSREFSLVLLGAGLLTTGYFLYDNDEKVAAEADKQAQKRVGGNGTTHRTGGMFVFISHGGGGSSVTGGRSPAMASVSKGGFGSIGSRVGGGAS